MLIERLRREETPSVSRILATVRWEDSDRLPQEIFFEVDSRKAEGLAPEAKLGRVVSFSHI